MGDIRRTWIGTGYARLLNRWLLPLAGRTGLPPNQMTVAGLAAAALVPAGFLLHPLAGAVLIVISGLADSMDGLLARSRHQSSAFGAFFDSCLDRISDGCYLIGFWVLFWPGHHPLAAGILLAAGYAATVTISYAKARAESLGIVMDVGLMERGARVVYLLLWSLLLAAIPAAEAPLLWTGALVYLGLTAATGVQRIRRARALLNAQRPPTPV